MENKTIDTNVSIILGRLTREPEFSNVGEKKTALCKFSIACNNGKENTDFFDIETWGKLAEICNQYINTGSQVLVTGRLYKNNWTDKELKKRSKIILKAHNVQFIGGKKDSQKPLNETVTEAIMNSDFSGEDNKEVPF